MQEIKKTRIVIASVLKPVDEPRMFDRIGQTLAANGFDIFIIGFPSSSIHADANIQFIAHKKFSRLSFSRWIASFKIAKKIFVLKPYFLIVNTHELLFAAVLYRLFTKSKIIYDVQENYWRNIIHTAAFPIVLKPLIAATVRIKEIAASFFIDQFLLAEKCYQEELHFTKRKSVVIENKCKMPSSFVRSAKSENIELLFTGTLAESTGVFEAIDLAKKLFACEPKIRLQIVGKCALPSTLKKIKKEIEQNPFISLTGGDEFVSHEIIMRAIASSHFAIIYYQPSPHTVDKIPTKLYEYLSCGLPILLQTNPKWIALCEPYHCHIAIDFENLNASSILLKMKEQKFYSVGVMVARWETEEEKLVECIWGITKKTNLPS